MNVKKRLKVWVTLAIVTMTVPCCVTAIGALVSIFTIAPGPDLYLIVNESEIPIRAILAERYGGGGWAPPLPFGGNEVLEPCGACRSTAAPGPRWELVPDFVRIVWAADNPGLTDGTSSKIVADYIRQNGTTTELLPMRSAHQRPTDEVILYRFSTEKVWTIECLSCSELKVRGYACGNWHSSHFRSK